MSTSTIALSINQYVKVNQGLNRLVVEAREGEIRVAVTHNQPAPSNKAYHRIIDGEKLELVDIDHDVWVYTAFSGAKAVVTELPATLSSDFDIFVSAGLSEHAKPVDVFGVNESVGTSAEDVWGGGGTFLFLDTASILTISSTSASDTSSGTGARTVKLIGLDNSYTEIEETVTLTGTGDVATTQSFLRLNLFEVSTAGSYGGAQGNVTASAGSNLQAIIVNGHNTSLSSIYTVPLGYVGLIFSIEVSVGKNRSVLTTLRARDFGGVFHAKSAVKIFQQSYLQGKKFALYLDEKTDVKMTAVADNPNAYCATEYQILLLDKEHYGA